MYKQLDRFLYLEVEFTIDWLVLSIDKLEGVRAIAVHVTIAVRSTSIGEEKRHLMSGLWSKRDKVPEHVGIFQVSSWISLLSMNE